MKKIIIGIILIILIALLIPIPRYLEDGGSVEYRAVLYTIIKYHKIGLVDDSGDAQNEYIEGISIKILGMEVYNNTNNKENKNDNDNMRGKNLEYKNEEEQKQNDGDNIVNNNSFVGTVLEETTTYMIVKPNEDEEESKSADKIRINYGTDHIDYLYGIGRKVIINYTGYIMETYPAQINTDDILINGYENFELTVETTDNRNEYVTEQKKEKKILNNTELYKNNSDYDLYYYGLNNVNITLDNKTMNLEDALRSGKMTIDGLIIKANKDFPESIAYKDGGSMEYHYKEYTIIKVHNLEGNRDVYIGTPEMTLNDIKRK